MRQLTLVAPDDGDDLEDEEWYETPRPSPTSRPRNDIANSRPRSRQPRQTTRAWKETLSRLRSTTEQTPAIRSAALPPGHEIVYVVDIPASLAGNGLVLEVATRSRKRDGEWSKPKGRRFALSEIEHLPEPADRQAMAILAGGREQVSSYYSGGGYATTTAPRLASTSRTRSSETLLPMLCATGRCLLRESEPDGSLRPLRWDDAGPWEFWLKVTPDDDRQDVRDRPASSVAPGSDWRWRLPCCC